MIPVIPKTSINPIIWVHIPTETMSLTMRALRLGQMSVKSMGCYAASTLPAVARYHTPYNYHSPDKPKSIWNGLVYGFEYFVSLICSWFHQFPWQDVPHLSIMSCLSLPYFFHPCSLCYLCKSLLLFLIDVGPYWLLHGYSVSSSWLDWYESHLQRLLWTCTDVGIDGYL